MEEVCAKAYGIQPGEISCQAEKFREMFAEHPRETRFVLEPGEYHFYRANAQQRKLSVSNSDQAGGRFISLLLEDMEQAELEGNGAVFWFHGEQTMLAMNRCRDIRIQNLTLDFAEAMTAEGRIVKAGERSVLISLDGSRFPYQVTGGKLIFKRLSGEECPCYGAIEVDSESGEIRKGAGDTFPNEWMVEEIGGKTEPDRAERFLKLCGDFKVVPKEGNLLILRFGKRVHPGILVHSCKEIRLSKCCIRQTAGLGCVFQFSRDLTVSGLRFVPNEGRGMRFVSGHDDGLHFSNCGGRVVIEGCTFQGLLDDPVNVHGTAVSVERVREIGNKDGKLRKSFTGNFVHPQSAGFPLWAKPGDQIAIVRRKDRSVAWTSTVEEYQLVSREKMELILTGVPELLEFSKKGSLALENLTNTPEVICRGNEFGSTRARGILVTTPRKVRILENVFHSSGSAVVLTGDVNEWYESGSCRDVEIARNRFCWCNTSSYQFCRGVIHIEPGIPGTEPYCVHKNIRIVDNCFQLADKRWIFADHAENLSVEGNLLVVRDGMGRAGGKDHTLGIEDFLKLRHCRGVYLAGNRVIEEKEAKDEGLDL